MKIKSIIALLLFQFGFSQERTCGTALYMQTLMNNSVAKQKHLDLQSRFEIELLKLQNLQNKSSASAIIIPVAVHFPSVATNSTDKACLRLLAQNQIDIINADFNATNADINLWSPTTQAFYPGTINGSLPVQFVLATQNHPADSGLSNGQKAVTFGTNFLNNADYDTLWRGYMNIVVRAAGALGYSPLGGNPSDGATVVINYDAFGSGAGCTGYAPQGDYNLGRTLSHELGHFFNLEHTFGNGGFCNDISNTDYLNDTPKCTGSGGCPITGTVLGCVTGQKSLTMNYMDYTDDACMYMFTANQATRMRAYYNTIASEYSTNVLKNDNFEFKNFALYPNPNNGSFKISFITNNSDEIKITINDMQGRKIFAETFENKGLFNQEIALDKAQSGIYLVYILNGQNKTVKRIVVE